MIQADVVIVGGGIAGLATAVTLCTASDLRVVMVEKAEIGANQGIRAILASAVAEFGLREGVLQDYTGFVLHSPLGSVAQFDVGRTIFSAVNYQKACTILFERAANCGLELRPTEALDWSPRVPEVNKPIFVRLKDGESIQTEILVDASGYAQWAARHLQIRPSAYYCHCIGEVLTHCSATDTTSFRFLTQNSRYGNGGGWFYPFGEDSASMGYSCIARTPRIDTSSLAAGYQAAKQEFKPYAEWVHESMQEGLEGGIIPVGRIGQFVHNRLLIVGDAAGQAHPWTIEGCRPHLYNGRLCAQVILSAFAQQRFDRSALYQYERQWNQANRERFWRTASVAEINLNRSDREWDQLTAAFQRLPPERQLLSICENQAPFFHQVYAVAGYYRRLLMGWIRKRRHAGLV